MEGNGANKENELGGQMSFLEHLDELRRRLVRCVIAIGVSFIICWTFADKIYNFLAIPVQREIANATQRKIQTDENFVTLKEGDTGRFIFDRTTDLNGAVIPVGSSVQAKVGECREGKYCIFTEEDMFVGGVVVPKGAKVADLTSIGKKTANSDEQLIITTAVEPFTLYVTVSLYAAIALSVPFLLWQIWGFISPALYRHERKYVTPFIGLSSISFVLGAAFAYYILFPPAVRYLLGLGEDFRIMLRATEYFDFIILIMLAMGIIFQMPAITYVLARIGIISASFLLNVWKLAIVIILIIAAVISPTGDIPNMMLFAAPMMALYAVSIVIAWIFGKKRQTDEKI